MPKVFYREDGHPMWFDIDFLDPVSRKKVFRTIDYDVENAKKQFMENFVPEEGRAYDDYPYTMVQHISDPESQYDDSVYRHLIVNPD